MEKDMTRRKLLQRAGYAIAAASFPYTKVGAAQEASSEVAKQPVSLVMNKLSGYMAEARGRQLPGEVVEKAKHHILDTFAAMLSGSKLPPGQAALALARAQAGRRVATVVGSAIVTGPIDAALANGMLAHSDETDDSHAASQSHPGASIVPA